MERYGNLEFASKKDLFVFMVENRSKLIAQRKAILKKEDMGISIFPTIVFDSKMIANKQQDQPINPLNTDSLKVVCIINTTNFLDSHMDVHIPGLWNKSLKDNKMIMHIQEHNMEFDKIISDGAQLKAYVKPFKWTELGYDFAGETEALVFESEILKKRNPYMLEQYANGWVKNHSVGMYYVKTDMAINDEDLPNYYEAWQKYYPQIANPEMADERGYFWYVLEAKCVEGSAVPIGSNTATPTLDNGTGKAVVICPNCGNEFDPGDNDIDTDENGNVICPNCEKPIQDCSKPEKNQPSQGTDDIPKPSEDTQEIDYEFLLTNLKN
jgi:hypothetical protein